MPKEDAPLPPDTTLSATQADFFDSAPTRSADAEEQLLLPLLEVPLAEPIGYVIKRDGAREPFDRSKIARTLGQALRAAGMEDPEYAGYLADAVTRYLTKILHDGTAHAEQISEAVERVLIELSHTEAAVAYVRFRERREQIRRLRGGDRHVPFQNHPPAQEQPPEGIVSGREAIPTDAGTEECDAEEKRLPNLRQLLQSELRLAPDKVEELVGEMEALQGRFSMAPLTRPLFYGLLDALLRRHGLHEARKKLRRITLPSAEVMDILCYGSGTPLTTDVALGRAVKRKYALTAVFSHNVADAHLNGDIHLYGVDAVDRLWAGYESFEQWWREAPVLAPLVRTSVPEDPVSTAAYWSALTQIFQTYTVSRISWTHLGDAVTEKNNEFRGPFDPFALAEAFWSEFLFLHRRARETAQAVPQLVLSISEYASLWEQSAEEGLHGESTFLVALLECAYQSCRRGIYTGASAFRVVLTPAVTEMPFGSDILHHAARLVLARFPMEFEFPRSGRPAEGSRDIVQCVAVNVARVAYGAENWDQFFGGLERSIDIALRGAAEKQAFWDALAEDSSVTPLHRLQRISAHRYPSPTQYVRLIPVGVIEAIVRMNGSASESCPETVAQVCRLLHRISDIAFRRGIRHGVKVVLGYEEEPEAASRFAELDLGIYPEATATALGLAEFAESQAAQAFQYRTIVRPYQEAGRSWLDYVCTVESIAQAFDDPPPIPVPIPSEGMDEEMVAARLETLTKKTRVPRVYFEIS